MEEAIWQEHVFILEKAIGVGFGIAISGGKDNPGMQTGDPAIVISDVIKGGPAYDKLKVNDIVLRVNSKPMFNMEHAKAVKELKNAGQRVELKIKRKVMVRVSPPPERMRRSRSRDLDSPRRRRSPSREYGDSRRPHRSRSREINSPRGRRSRRRSYSRSSSRGRSYSRSPSYNRRSYSRGSSPSYRKGRSRSRSSSLRRSRSRTPSYRRTRSRSRTPSRSSYRSRSPSPRRSRPRNKMEKHRPVNDLRDTASPLSPDPDSPNYSDSEMMIFPVKQRDPKKVILKKTKQNHSYGLKLGTRIFIQDIQPGSLADKGKDLTSGDTVLMINGRNMDNKSVQDAIQIIGQNKDKVTMLVRKEDGGTVSLPAERFRAPEREKRKESREEKPRRHSRRSSLSKESSRSSRRRSSASEPRSSKPDKKHTGGIRVLPTSSATRRHSSTSRSTPEPAPRSRHDPDREYAEPPGPEEEDSSFVPAAARQIVFVKGKNVGIRLAGGNDVGIFVASVQEGSPAAKQGLKMGDKILSVNEVNFKNTVREDAVVTLMGLPVGDKVKIIAQAQPEQYKKVLEHGTGDSFYIRTHFKYEKSAQHELSFTRGSAFHISDTLYQGMVGYWLAVRIGRNSKEIERGVIPNNNRAEQLKMVQDKKRAAMRDRSNRGISRRIKMQKSDASVVSSTSAMFPAYERVVLREAGFKRPVVIFGPLADVARQRLAGDYYDSYEIARNEGVVKGQKSNRKGVIRLNTIKDIIEQDKHAILDITPTAVEKLNYAQLYPIVVYLDAPTKNLVKSLRSKLATTDEERKKKAGKLFDRANKLKRGYSHVFTDTIRLDEADAWYRKLHSTIKDQQGMPVWVSKDKLGGGGDEAEEGVTVPGDDDQLSYVSAPASDYSVTTVGSDILNNSRLSDEEDRHQKKSEPRTKHRVSTSEEEDAGNKFGDDDFDDISDEEPPPDHVVAPPSVSKPVSTAAPPKLTQPKAAPVRQPSTSSSSSEDEPPAPVTTKSPPSHYPTRTEQPQESPKRGGKEIPAGRFDPQSFLKNHIRGLKPVGKEEPQGGTVTSPSYRQELPVSNSRAEPYNAAPVEKPEPQQPLYAQVNKNRPKQAAFQRDRRDSAGRDTTDDYNSYPSYKTNNTRPMDNRPPVRQEPTRNAAPPATYNRFAGSTQTRTDPRSSNPYNPPKPAYQRPPVANGMPPKSNYMQDRYREKTDPYTSNPRPYNAAPPPKSSYNGPGNKEQMYDSGVDTYYNAKPKKDSVPVSPTNIEEEDPQVVATARGVFDSNGGVLSSVETGVSIVIPKGAIRPGVRQEIYFKVCRDNTALPPLDKNKGETLLSPLVMCGPHGLQFDHPVELRLPHCEPSQWPNERNEYETGGNSVSVLIDHF